MIKMISRYLRFPGGKSKALTLSYDDGVQQDLRFAEILKKHGIKCTFNINAGLFPPEDKVFPKNQIHRRMKQSEILNAYPQDLFEVACHGYTHPWLEKLDPANVTAEVLEDRRALEALFHRPIQGMAYPYGTFSDTVVEILKNCGIRYCRTVVSTHKFDMPSDWLRMPATCHHRDPMLMELADQFLQDSRYPTPQLFYLWGHTYEFDHADQSWDIIENFAQKMGGHDNIWYATNMEIYTAWLDFTRLESTADGNVIYNPNCRSVWFADRLSNVYEVKPGATLYL
jgi:peptidoglycan/xylan/chitin deacetylase (PgdA/CDA1 family)